MDRPAEAVRIPYDSTTVSGYLFAPDDSGEARATVIFPCGYDSTRSRLGQRPRRPGARDNALVFEGPGQGEALYTQRLFLRPDFEHVLTPVLDWLLTRPEVQPMRSCSSGGPSGATRPRAASFEHRLAALVCDPAQPDMGARIPGGLAGKIAAPVVRAQMRISADRAEFFGARRQPTASTASRNTSPSCAGSPCSARAADHLPHPHHRGRARLAGGGGQTFTDALTAPSQLVPLTEHQGADGHCGGLGQEIWSEAVYRWLRNTLPDGLAAVTGKEKEHDH